MYRYLCYIIELFNGYIWVLDFDNNVIKIEVDCRYLGVVDLGFGFKGICIDVDDYIIVCVVNKV